MTLPTSYQKVPGLIMAISSAIFWGISGTCAQYLFEEKQVDPAWLVTWRMILAGAILVIFSIASEKKIAFEIWRKPKNAIKLVLFGLLGMVAVQFTYFYSISLSNAATATILQYIGPVFVVAFYAFKNKKWPILAEYAALTLALTGTFLLVTHGSLEELVISEKAIFWGILSALALAFYTIQPVGLLRTFSPAAVTGWGMLVGGVFFSLFTQPWELSGSWDSGTISAFAYIVIFGTVIAFYFFLKSVTIIGATFASLLCSVEPLAAALTAVFWLNVSFFAMDWIGTLLILLTVVVLTLSKEKK
ncbi:MAG: DMT family transporter [Algoriphagus aquaeductus]|jgi:drug/metabolite transporter (DMT)-like permease|uniref:Threonine/homoserine efflux transporter RhtA n=1 Tax=Algoriphagus aquaeductus TaxID=475299 RepID=A0A326SBW9_9BACT|nr:EamA family transporter [Algoriphagus aquaeductus]PZV87506.1 threonine/homoserine efflux transporter RhtA [Algoriphagus aquaeductus]